MANDVSCDLHINSNFEAIKTAIGPLVGGDLVDFARIVPPPSPEADDRAWRKEHWGTGSKGYNAHYGRFRLTFSTAWTVPVEWVIALAKKFPGTTIWVEWFGRGSGQCGGYMLEGTDLNDEAIAGEPIDVWSCNDYRGHRGG